MKRGTESSHKPSRTRVLILGSLSVLESEGQEHKSLTACGASISAQ